MSEENKETRAYVLWLLSRKEYSRSQLEKKLRARKCTPLQIDSLLDNLKEEGLFRETAYQKARTRQLLRRGLGASLVKSRLRGEKCPIDNNDIDTAYEELGSDATSQLRQQIQKLLRRFEKSIPIDLDKKIQKITKSLQAKGHSFAEISKWLKQELKDLEYSP